MNRHKIYAAISIVFLIISQNAIAEKKHVDRKRLGVGVSFEYSDKVMRFGQKLDFYNKKWPGTDSENHELPSSANACFDPGRLVSLAGIDIDSKETLDRAIFAAAYLVSNPSIVCELGGSTEEFQFDVIIEVGSEGGPWFILADPPTSMQNDELEIFLRANQGLSFPNGIEWEEHSSGDGVTFVDDNGRHTGGIAIRQNHVIGALFPLTGNDVEHEKALLQALGYEVIKNQSRPGPIVILGSDTGGPKMHRIIRDSFLKFLEIELARNEMLRIELEAVLGSNSFRYSTAKELAEEAVRRTRASAR